MKRKSIVLAFASFLFYIGNAGARPAEPTPSEWSAWMSKRGHFQFQMLTEEVTPSVMRIRIRIRPDVEKIAAEPHYANEPYYLEYYQMIHSENTGGYGSTSFESPRRLVFPANATETCVYEEEDIYAMIRPPGAKNRIYMDRSFSPLPLAEQDGAIVSGFEYVLAFGNNVDPGAVTRFTGTSPELFTLACN